MQNADLLQTIDNSSGSHSPFRKDRTEVAEEFVGQSLAPMSDEEREAAAYRAGVAMQAWYSQYQQTGNPKFLDNAYQCLGMQKRLLAGRSHEYVARLERERGIS